MKKKTIVFDCQGGNDCVNGGCSNSFPAQGERHFGGQIPEGIGYWKPVKALDPFFQIFFLFGSPSLLDEFNQDRTGNGGAILIQKEGESVFNLGIATRAKKQIQALVSIRTKGDMS